MVAMIYKTDAPISLEMITSPKVEYTTAKESDLNLKIKKLEKQQNNEFQQLKNATELLFSKANMKLISKIDKKGCYNLSFEDGLTLFAMESCLAKLKQKIGISETEMDAVLLEKIRIPTIEKALNCLNLSEEIKESIRKYRQLESRHYFLFAKYPKYKDGCSFLEEQLFPSSAKVFEKAIKAVENNLSLSSQEKTGLMRELVQANCLDAISPIMFALIIATDLELLLFTKQFFATGRYLHLLDILFKIKMTQELKKPGLIVKLFQILYLFNHTGLAVNYFIKRDLNSFNALFIFLITSEILGPAACIGGKIAFKNIVNEINNASKTVFLLIETYSKAGEKLTNKMVYDVLDPFFKKVQLPLAAKTTIVASIVTLAVVYPSKVTEDDFKDKEKREIYEKNLKKVLDQLHAKKELFK
ncbi:MAG: hypothetical protein AB1391_04425 [Candidatus Micrarchaeota archaeon]